MERPPFDRLCGDLLRFGRLLFTSRDYDPIYFVLRRVIQEERIPVEPAHWLVFLYLTFYNTSSAWAFYRYAPRYEDLFTTSGLLDAEVTQWEATHRKRLTLNIERRGLRGGHWLTMLEQMPAVVGDSFYAWWTAQWSAAKQEAASEARYLVLWDRFPALPYCGRWATFKWLDLCQHVLGYPIAPPDMRLADCSGPRHALEELYLGAPSTRKDPAYIDYLNTLGGSLREWLHTNGLSLEWDTLETLLCNFHSLMGGRYYVGHDLDEHLENTRHGLGEAEPWMAARLNEFDHQLLGELNGWDGVRRNLCRVYRDSGQIYCERALAQ